MPDQPAPLTAAPPDTARLAPSDAASAAPAPPDKPRGGPRGCLIEIVQTLIATVVIFFGIQAFVAQPFQVQQQSMERTFFAGDYVLVDRLSHLWSPYARGQVIVFQPPPSVPDAGKPFIKRVIGVAGDTVELRDGTVYVNGVALDEPYLYRDAAGNVQSSDSMTGQSSWLVPAGQLFVMGDHRQLSSDSRVFGPIDVSSVIGRALVRYWPVDRFGFIASASYADLPAP